MKVQEHYIYSSHNSILKFKNITSIPLIYELDANNVFFMFKLNIDTILQTYDSWNKEQAIYYTLFPTGWRLYSVSQWERGYFNPCDNRILLDCFASSHILTKIVRRYVCDFFSLCWNNQMTTNLHQLKNRELTNL